MRRSDVTIIVRVCTRIGFAFVELAVIGWLCVFFLLSLVFYHSLKESLIYLIHTARSTLHALRFEMEILWNGVIDFDGFPYPVKRRFVEMLPREDFDSFKSASKRTASLARCIRDPVIDEIVYDLGDLSSRCHVRESGDSRSGAMVVPSNLVVANLGIYRRLQQVKRVGIMGAAQPSHDMLRLILDAIPAQTQIDWFFVDLNLESLDLFELQRLLDKLQSRQLTLNLEFAHEKQPLGPILDLINEQADQIQLFVSPSCACQNGLVSVRNEIETWLSCRQTTPKSFHLQTMTTASGSFIQYHFKPEPDSSRIHVTERVTPEFVCFQPAGWISFVP